MQNTMMLVAFGLGFGLAQILFGLGIAAVGMALNFAIAIGISTAFGSLLPLLIQHRERIFTPQGHMIFLGVFAGRGRNRWVRDRREDEGHAFGICRRSSARIRCPENELQGGIGYCCPRRNWLTADQFRPGVWRRFEGSCRHAGGKSRHSGQRHLGAAQLRGLHSLHHLLHLSLEEEQHREPV